MTVQEWIKSSLSPTSLNLNWDDNSDNEQGFEIDWNVAGSAKSDTVATDVTSYTVTGLTCNTTYTVQVFAYNTLNSDPISQSGTTSACDPKAPTRFRTTSVSSSSVGLAWDKPVYIGPVLSGYQVYKLSDLIRGTHWVAIGSVTAPTVTFSDTGVSCGHTYYYSVRSVFSGPTYSSYVPALAVTTPVCPPNAPPSLAAAPASQIEIDLSWTPPAAGPAATGYNLERADHTMANWTQIYSGANTTYIDAVLTCQTTYDYRVQAYNDSGAGIYSSSVSAQTVECSPAAPSNLAANSITQTSLTLTWDDNSSDEDGFSIQRSPGGLNNWDEIGTVGAGVVAYPDADPALACGTAYDYRVLAYNAGGHSTPTGALITGTTPCQPTILARAGGEGLVTLTWRDASHTTTSYIVDRTTIPLSNKFWTKIGTTTGDIFKLLDLTAPCGQTLYYRVHAVNSLGSAISPTSDAVQTVCKPTTAMTLTFDSSTLHSIHLTWTATLGGQTSFVVLRSATGTDGWFAIATLPTTDSSLDDNALEPAATYYYRLQAVNTGGASLSNVVSGTTQNGIFLPLITR